jgi:hypothetical protein
MAIFSDTARMLSIIIFPVSGEMCAVFNLATFIPALYRDWMNSISHRWSDMVATIFVCLIAIYF